MLRFATTMLPNSTSQNISETFSSVQLKLSLRVALGIFYVIVVVLTLAGNLFVISSVIRFRRLRTSTNFFVVSLAFADLTVAFLVLPFAIIYDITGVWNFGWEFCLFWRSCDVMCCTSSILHLCCISMDRYLAVTDPFMYRKRMSHKRIVKMIACVWTCSAGISFIPFYTGLFAKDSDSLYLEYSCDLIVNKIYAIFSSMTSFYIPLIIMLIAYATILRIARKQARRLVREQCVPSFGKCDDDKKLPKRIKALANDTKAIRTLGIIMGVFIISWLPFFLMYLILSFCESCYLSNLDVSLITWLGYANSFLNPMIYAYLNRDFKQAFRKIFICNKKDESFTLIKQQLEKSKSFEKQGRVDVPEGLYEYILNQGNSSVGSAKKNGQPI